MAVDWGFAGLVGGIGFGAVFILLVILAIVIWLTGLILNRSSSAKTEAGDKKKGD